ncbi:MAG: 3-oxoacyl-[acyl-carrier-protein] reductase FabG [Alphaproteobacteria bacterium MarineAlpha2_Bin1]|nr:MAG: 3-oxoacyl-[acyl-carrier-protein] reductase FabG [Alphaproteobacteria bacterium MarineAlpha2_Bin1]
MEHRSVCIVGSGGGIGTQIVKLFRKKGYDPLVMMDRPSNDFDNISRGYESEKIEINLESDDSIKNAFYKAKEITRKINVFIFTAGIVENKNLKNLNLDEWNKVLSINLTGFYKCMVEAENWISSNGRIVTLGSMAGHQGSFVTGPAYAASKGGMEGFTKYLASYFADRKITANCIAPGPVDTKMLDVHDRLKLEERKKLIPLKRFAKPEEIAAAVLFLASEDSGYITGTVMPINAGMVMK